MILLITANGYCTELYFGEDMENIIKILEIMVALLFGLLMLFIATYMILLLYNVGKYIIYKIEQKVINKKNRIDKFLHWFNFMLYFNFYYISNG